MSISSILFSQYEYDKKKNRTIKEQQKIGNIFGNI